MGFFPAFIFSKIAQRDFPFSWFNRYLHQLTLFGCSHWLQKRRDVKYLKQWSKPRKGGKQ